MVKASAFFLCDVMNTHALDERIDKKAVTILDNKIQYYAVRYGTLSRVIQFSNVIPIRRKAAVG